MKIEDMRRGISVMLDTMHEHEIKTIHDAMLKIFMDPEKELWFFKALQNFDSGIHRYVVEYSKDQNCFHIQEELEMAGKNINLLIRLLKGQEVYWPDYLVVSIATSHEDAQAICSKLKTIQDEKREG